MVLPNEREVTFMDSVKQLVEKYLANPEEFSIKDLSEIADLNERQKAIDEGFLFHLIGLVVNDLQSLEWAYFLGMVLHYYERTDLPDDAYTNLYNAFEILVDLL
jgi:hypothetical protein